VQHVHKVGNRYLGEWAQLSEVDCAGPGCVSYGMYSIAAEH